MRYLLITAAACLSLCLCAPCLGGDVVQICCYSTSPADYAPNCYKCPSTVYASTLLACVNATEMPRNITFKQAVCVEKNCAINYPQPESEDTSLARYSNLISLFGQIGQLLQGGTPAAAAARAKREAEVVRKVETFVSGVREMDIGDMEYM